MELGLPKRFWDKVLRRPDGTGCWEWTAFRDPNGYGRVLVNGKVGLAHRAVLSRKLGRPLASHEVSRHTCDNPACVNPSHLIVGAQSDNIADMVFRDRHARGERATGCKLTEDKVREIRKDTRTIRAIANHYGISTASVIFIRQRKRWRHV